MRWLDHVIAAAPNFFASGQIFSNFSTSPATRLHCPRDGQESARRRNRPNSVCNPKSESKTEIGAGSRIRTDDLLITNQLLYQLSYAGKNAAQINARCRLKQVADALDVNAS